MAGLSQSSGLTQSRNVQLSPPRPAHHPSSQRHLPYVSPLASRAAYVHFPLPSHSSKPVSVATPTHFVESLPAQWTVQSPFRSGSHEFWHLQVPTLGSLTSVTQMPRI